MKENIPEVIKGTAKNMHELLMQIAAFIEKLEAENAELKAENERISKQS